MKTATAMEVADGASDLLQVAVEMVQAPSVVLHRHLR